MSRTTYSVGIDIGGTTVKYALVTGKGEIIASGDLATRDFRRADEFLERLSDLVNGMVADSGVNPREVAGIGVGAPCVNSYTCAIEGATDMPWESPIPLGEYLRRRTGLKLRASNDANAAALGEMQYGAARGMKSFIVMTLGTGVGSGIVVDGHLLNGTTGFAGELGHTWSIGAEDRLCTCGRYGCLQTVASAGGVVMTARRMLAGDCGKSGSMLGNVPEHDLTAKFIAECAHKGDKLAMAVYEFTGKVLGTAFATYAAFTDPEAIILFGGVAKAFDLMESSIREAFDRNVLFLYKDRVKLLHSTLPDADAAVLGAASLPYNN